MKIFIDETRYTPENIENVVTEMDRIIRIDPDFSALQYSIDSDDFTWVESGDVWASTAVFHRIMDILGQEI